MSPPTIGLDEHAIERYQQNEAFDKRRPDSDSAYASDSTPRRAAQLAGQPAPPDVHCDKPRELIPELCRQFYNLGWVSGTGGGMSIRQAGLIYVAPSGVQKERLAPEDLFVLDDAGRVLEPPRNSQLKISECFSLFMLCYTIRNAGCCIHTHSKYANLVGRLAEKLGQRNAQTNCLEFRVSNQEMIKGIKRGASDQSHKYSDTIVVPIIDNVLCEKDLKGPMEKALLEYPTANAVLVKNHGAYFWGRTWMHAKGMAECYDYLFQIQLEAHRYNLA